MNICYTPESLMEMRSEIPNPSGFPPSLFTRGISLESYFFLSTFEGFNLNILHKWASNWLLVSISLYGRWKELPTRDDTKLYIQDLIAYLYF